MIKPESMKLLAEFLAQITEREIEIEAAREALLENDEFSFSSAFNAIKHPSSKEIKSRDLANFLTKHESTSANETLDIFFSTYSSTGNQSLSFEEFVKFLLPSKVVKDKKVDIYNYILATEKNSHEPLHVSTAWALSRTLLYELKLLEFIEASKKELLTQKDWDVCVAFNRITEEKNRAIDVNNLSWFFKSNGHSINTAMCAILIKRFDRNEDGLLDYAEFVEIFFNYNRYSRIITRRSLSPHGEQITHPQSSGKIVYSTKVSQYLSEKNEHNGNEKVRPFLIDNPSEESLMSLRGSVRGRHSKANSISIVDGTWSPTQSTMMASTAGNSRNNSFGKLSGVISHSKKNLRLSSMAPSNTSVSHFLPTTIPDTSRTAEMNNFLFSPNSNTQSLYHNLFSESKSKFSGVPNKHNGIPLSPSQQANLSNLSRGSALNEPHPLRDLSRSRFSVTIVDYSNPSADKYSSPERNREAEMSRIQSEGLASDETGEYLTSEREELNKVLQEFLKSDNLIKKLRRELSLTEDFTPTAIYKYMLMESNSYMLNKSSLSSFLMMRGLTLDKLQIELLFGRLDQDRDGEISLKDLERVLSLTEEMMQTPKNSAQRISRETIELFERFLIKLIYVEIKLEEIRTLLANRKKSSPNVSTLNGVY